MIKRSALKHTAFTNVNKRKLPKQRKEGTPMNNQTHSSAQRYLTPIVPCRSPQTLSMVPVIIAAIAICLFAMAVTAASAGTKIETHPELVTEKLPRPSHIWVYDFAATASDLPANSALSGMISEDAASQTPQHVAEGRKLGAEIAAELVNRILAMEMPAEQAVKETTPQINDIVIRGCLISFDEGDKKKRVLIGLRSGSSHLKVAAEGFQMTSEGLRKLGSVTGDSGGGGKTPGGAIGAATALATRNPAGLIISTGIKVHGEKSGKSTVEGRAKQMADEIADALKKRFEEQGWIK